MGIRFYQEPQLENPILVASWPGIGNIGIIAVDTLKGMLGAEELGEIEPWEFFYPKRVLIRKGVLESWSPWNFPAANSISSECVEEI